MKTKLVSILLLAIISLCSCSTNTGNLKKDRAGRVTNAVLQEAGSLVEKETFNTLANIVDQSVQGKKIDLAYSLSAGVYSSMLSIDGAGALKHIADAWSGNQLPAVSNAAATAFAKANPQTPADKAAVASAIASGVSKAALAISGV